MAEKAVGAVPDRIDRVEQLTRFAGAVLAAEEDKRSREGDEITLALRSSLRGRMLNGAKAGMKL